MKTSKDPRHIYRKKIIKALYANSFLQHNYESESINNLLKKLPEIDTKIQQAAPTWPLDNINKIDLAILRFAIFELMEGDVPEKVVIDEAVELAKEFGSENSSSFINGVLGTIYDTNKL